MGNLTDHHHHHHHHAPDLGETRLIWALAVNVLLTGVQIAGGIVSGSLALVADALHNLSDAGSLGVALLARRIAKRPADEWRTFGYQRAELIGALINLTALILIGLYLIYEAAMRYYHPRPVEGWLVVYVGAFALVVDTVTALLTFTGAKESLNIRAAFLHNVADALGSVAVIVAGTVIIVYGWTLIDPLCTVLIAAYAIWHGWSEMKHTIRILMQSTPLDIDLAELIHTLEREPGVLGVHHVHVWEIDEHRRSLEAHVVIDPRDASRIEEIKQGLKRRLAQRYRIRHSTLEFELETPETARVCPVEGQEVCGHPRTHDHPHHPTPFPWGTAWLILAIVLLLVGLTLHFRLAGGWQSGLDAFRSPAQWSGYEWLAYGAAFLCLLMAGWSYRGDDA